MFIIFEGGEGSGKMILIEKLKYILLEKKYDVLIMCEFGGLNVVEKICFVLLDNKNIEIIVYIEVFLFVVSRV